MSPEIGPGLKDALEKEFKLILRSFMSTYLLIILICARIFISSFFCSLACFFFRFIETKANFSMIYFFPFCQNFFINLSCLPSLTNAHGFAPERWDMYAKSLPSSTRLSSKGPNLILVLSQQSEEHKICPLIIIGKISPGKNENSIDFKRN